MHCESAKVDGHPIGAKALETAIERLGGVSAAARALGVSRQLLQGWRDPNRRFATPAEYCPALEAATSVAGAPVRCEELRPDVQWSVLRERSAA